MKIKRKWFEKSYGKICLYYYEDNPKIGYLSSFYIDPKKRNKWLGTKLIQGALEDAKKQNMSEVFLMCFRHTWIYEWYQRLGFEFDSIDNDDSDYAWMKFTFRPTLLIEEGSF